MNQSGSHAGQFTPGLTQRLTSSGWPHVGLFDEVDSTNTVAAQRAAEGHLVAARAQTAGRGRLGRAWSAPVDSGVMMSVTLPLPAHTELWGWMPLFVGEAVLRALRPLIPDADVGLKWPNDIVVRTADSEYPVRKLAGILCQLIPGAAGQSVVVAGVGVNVSQQPDELPIPQATSLTLQGYDPASNQSRCAQRDEVLVAVAQELAQLARSIPTPAKLAQRQQDVRDACVTIGAHVDVHAPDGTIVPTVAIGIGDDGQLLTRRHVGADVVSYSVADIVHAKVS